MLNAQTLQSFGLRRSPFPQTPSETPYDSADLRNVQEQVRWAVEERGACAVIGPPLSGKSTATWTVLDELGQRMTVKTVEVLNPDRRHMIYSSIEAAMLKGLAPERRIPRNAELKAIMSREILGKLAQAGTRTVLVIEEAQSLRSETMLSLKRLREFRWGRHCPLISLVLIGHLALGEKLDRIQEVGLRIAQVGLRGLGPDEAVAYLTHQFSLAGRPDPMTEEAMRQLGTRESWPGMLNRLAELTLEAAYLAGRRQATLEDTSKVLNIKPMTRRGEVSKAGLAAAINRKNAQRQETVG